MIAPLLRALAPLLSCILFSQGASAQLHVIGWQTFENKVPGNNNSGIQDDTPDSNSTYDATPMGPSSGNVYLTGSIGTNASANGWDGYGQATNNDFLNGGTFGDALAITNITLADGSPGIRIGPFGNPPPNGEANGGTSSWKFAEAGSANLLQGDFSITNHSDYHFELGHIHFDARGLADVATSPRQDQVSHRASPTSTFPTALPRVPGSRKRSGSMVNCRSTTAGWSHWRSSNQTSSSPKTCGPRAGTATARAPLRG